MTFLPVESITVGIYALALSIITVLVAVVVDSVPGGLGTIRGSKLGLGTGALNSNLEQQMEGRVCHLSENLQNEALQQVLDYTSL